MDAMRTSSLPKALLALNLLVCASTVGCGRKGDPIPRVRQAARAPLARWATLRSLEVTLPTQDTKGQDLVGLEQLRVIWVPVGLTRPTATEVASQGEVVLERRRPDLPKPGGTFRLDLGGLKRKAGWVVLVAVRGGEVAGLPSEVLPWMDPAL